MRPSGGTSRNRTDISFTVAKAGTFPHCSVSPPVHYSGGPVFADCQDKCHDFCSRWWRQTDSNRLFPEHREGLGSEEKPWVHPAAPYNRRGFQPAGRSFPAVNLKEGDSTTPKYRPCGAAYRTRTGDTCLEGRGVTTTPMLRITAGAFDRRAGLSLQSRQKKKRGDHPGGHKPGGGWSGIRTQLPSACADGAHPHVLPTRIISPVIARSAATWQSPRNDI